MEGLPCVRKIVTALTDAAPVILFSAAVPGQGGNNHINEQWPEYWCQLFKALGYDVLDPIRPRIREDKRVAWWYRQNILIFACKDAISHNEALKADAARRPRPELEWVHISVTRKEKGALSLLRAAGHALPLKLQKRLKRPIKAALRLR